MLLFDPVDERCNLASFAQESSNSNEDYLAAAKSTLALQIEHGPPKSRSSLGSSRFSDLKSKRRGRSTIVANRPAFLKSTQKETHPSMANCPRGFRLSDPSSSTFESAVPATALHPLVRCISLVS
jgi:hypothetical protein